MFLGMRGRAAALTALASRALVPIGAGGSFAPKRASTLSVREFQIQ
jgi:hypothetical protein